MTEPTYARSDISPEMSIPQASLESILCTEELQRRPSRPPDYEKENRALVKLVSALADSPRTILRTLAETILDITQCDSAGLSLLTKDGKKPDVCGKRFYWPAIAGMWNPHVGGGTPRNFGPCGDVLDQNCTLLFRHFERRYPYLLPVIPAAEECLLVPFHVAGEAVGTIWAIMHSDRRKFDAEDQRVMGSLGQFASSAYQTVVSIDDLKFQVAEREKAETELRKLTDGLETKVRVRTEELEQRNRQLGEARARLAEEKLALERSEAYLTEAQRLSQTGSYGCTPSTGEMFWSEETFRIYGYDRSTQPSVERVLQRVHPEDKPFVKEQMGRATREGKDCHVECRLLLPDDTVKHVRIVAHASKNELGIVEFIGAVMDVTATKQAEERLRRSEDFLAEGQSLSHTGSFGWNVSSGEIVWSEETYKIFEYDRAVNPTLESAFQRIHPDDRDLVQQTIDRASEARASLDFEHRLLMPDGSVKHLHVLARALEPSSGNLEYVGAVTDVTAAKRSEETLRRSEGYLAEAQRLSHTGSWVWRVPGRDPLHLSEEWYRIYGFDPADGMPGWEKRLQGVHPEDRARWQGTIERAIREKSDYEAEFRILLPDGTLKWIHSVGHPVVNASGDLLQFVGTVIDITERKRAEEELRTSEAHLAEAQRLSHTGSWVWRVPGRDPLHLSEEWYRIYGFDPADGMPGWEKRLQRAHPEDRARWQEAIERAIREKSGYEVEYRILLPDGTLKWIHAVGHPVFNASGDLLQFVGSSTDITERKRADEALRRSEERHRSVLETATDAVVSVDHRSQIIFANPATTKTFGYQISEMIGQPLTMLMPEVMREVHKAGFQRYLKTNQRHVDWRGVQLIGLRKNGEEFPVEVSFGEVLESGHHIFTGFIRDTTERKQAEEKIREQEAELRQVLELAPQHVTVLGPDGSRLYLNQAGLDYYGLTLEEWRTYDTRRFFHPDDLERMTSGAQIKLLSGTPHEVEARLLRRDGRYRWFLIRRNPLRDEQGRITRWYAAATDIEDRKQAEQRLQDENVALREEIDRTSMFEEIVGISPALQTVLSRVSKVAPTDSTVLITGETGTGKELVARAIHRRSHRSSCAFISVNCAAIPRDLIASELFGHEKGAFTGATQRRLGRFELGHGGTIFLDEVGELPAETQIALLRVLQEHEFGRVGGTGSIRTNVRVIAATNRDLEAAIAAGTFRSDLFYRLNVFPIDVPPLRERREDIPVLVEYFIDRYASKAGKSIRGVNKKSLELLQSYPWPGNIRELQNVIERSVIVCDTENFSVDESWLSRQPLANRPKTYVELARKPAAKEREIIEAALRESGGRVYGPSGAASKLGIPRSTLESKIRSLKISKSHFKAMDSSKNS
jgi:PAS domain S-box-containing protein